MDPLIVQQSGLNTNKWCLFHECLDLLQIEKLPHRFEVLECQCCFQEQRQHDLVTIARDRVDSSRRLFIQLANLLQQVPVHEIIQGARPEMG